MSKHNTKLNKTEDMIREFRLLKRAVMRTLLPAKEKYQTEDCRKGGRLPKEWR